MCVCVCVGACVRVSVCVRSQNPADCATSPVRVRVFWLWPQHVVLDTQEADGRDGEAVDAQSDEVGTPSAQAADHEDDDGAGDEDDGDAEAWGEIRHIKACTDEPRVFWARSRHSFFARVGGQKTEFPVSRKHTHDVNEYITALREAKDKAVAWQAAQDSGD